MALTDKLTAIADAIRSKTGSTDPLTLDGMVTAVEGIQAGGSGFPNGMEWTQAKPYASGSTFYQIKMADGLLVAVSNKKVFTSTDGMTWSNGTTTSFQSASVAYGSGVLVAADDYLDAGLWYSTDGTSWTKGLDGAFATVRYANGIFVAVSYGSSGTGFWYSTDGKAWSQSNVTTGGFNNFDNGVDCVDGVWIATNGSLYLSDDGITWEKATVSGNGMTKFNRAISFKGVFVAISNLYPQGVYYSTDRGTTWTKSNVTGNNIRKHALCNHNGVLFCCSGNSGIWSSTDGITWVNTSSDDLDYIKSACGIMIAGSSGVQGLWYSTDGISWTQSNITDETPVGIEHYNGMWFSGGRYIYYSPSWLP